MNINHSNLSVVDALSLLGELEHTRRHALLAAINAPEEEALSLLVLAKQCQETRRNVQREYFPDLDERHWCLVKCASRMLQLTEELAEGDLEQLKTLKLIIDQTIHITTGEDISGCEACRQDAIEEDE